MKSGKCKLCGKVKLLLNESHIIPDSLYKYVFNLDHSLIKFESQKSNKYLPKYTRHYNGEYEGGILCQNCDNVILGQNLEDYGSKIFIEKILGNTISNNTYLGNYVNFDTLSNIDYRKFKVYLLSILWRMSICNRSFFKGVDLGRHEMKLRNIILNEDPVKVGEYPIILLDCNDNVFNLNGLISGPVRLLIGSVTSYSVLIAGIIIIFKLTENERSASTLKHTIKPNGELDIIRLDNITGREFLEEYFQISQVKDV